MSNSIDLWLHLLGLAVYFGATALLLLLLLPASSRYPEAAARQKYLAVCFRAYNPLSIAALGVQVMTGAFNLTSYKSALLSEFYARVGTLLAWKLSLVFVLVMTATYISFGLGHRIVRHEDWQEQLGEEKLRSMERRLLGPLVLVLLLTAAITWISLGLPGRLAG